MSVIEEHVIARIRNKLQEDGIKLWNPPYYTDNSTNHQAVEELAVNYSDIFAISTNITNIALTTLQAHALEKIASISQFKQTGLATLRIKVAGSNQQTENVKIQLCETGEALKNKVLSCTSIPVNSRLKLVCSGVIIESSKSLQSQKVTNNSQVLVLVLPSDVNSQRVEEELIREVEQIKADADYLASREDSDYLRIADQSGKIINLPFEEKKSLAVALALHEKGRSALKRNQVTFALTLFHEADNKFNECRSELLQSVDNAAILNLDIAWCYLLLGNAADIPDAVVRLGRCERSLFKSYGAQMERLLTLKGTTGNEAVLFLRLHLLQGVVAFHQGKTIEASWLLQQAKEELAQLTINDDDLSQLLSLGYSLADSRLGLRACRGDLNGAVVFLQRKEEERIEQLKREREEEKLNRERKKLGKTDNGQWVNLGYLNTIVNMGYERNRAINALKKSNNDVNQTFELLRNEFESLESEAAAGGFDDELVAQVVSLGFGPEEARRALEDFQGDLELAIDSLTSGIGRSKMPNSQTSSEEKMETKKEAEAYKRLAEDLPGSPDDHLDTNLELETEYLQKYLNFLSA